MARSRLTARRNPGFVTRLLLAVCVALPVSGGGNRETHRDPPAQPGMPRLEAARPNPVDDISDYEIRFAAWWNGPDTLTIVGRETLSLWREVEQRYDVRLAWLRQPNPQTVVEKLVSTVLLGEPFADVVWINSWDAIPSLVEANMILPLDEYIDFADDRIQPQFSDTITYAGRVYGFHPIKLGGGGGVWFNRTLLQREGFRDPHELIDRDEWTWERFYEIAQATTNDRDGDGEIDQFGLAVGYEIEYPIIWSNGGRIVVEVDDGFEFSMDEEPVLEALEFISRIHDANIVTHGQEQFIAGNAALYFGYLFQGNEMVNNMEDEFGFAWWPRGPRAMDHISMGAGGAIMVFPANLNYPPERLGRIVLDQIPFDIASDVQREFIEGQLIDQRSVELVYQMMARGGATDMYLSFPGLQRWVGEIFRDVRRGTSPATAVEQYHRPAQESIDALFR